MRRRVHHGLDLEEGRERGAVASIIVVRALRAEEKHWSSWLGEGVSRGGGTSQSSRLLERFGPSASCQSGLVLWLWGVGGRRVSKMGAWSDPVEGRVDGSLEPNAGNICGLAKAMSIALGLWRPCKGKSGVHTQGIEEAEAQV